MRCVDVRCVDVRSWNEPIAAVNVMVADHDAVKAIAAVNVMVADHDAVKVREVWQIHKNMETLLKMNERRKVVNRLSKSF